MLTQIVKPMVRTQLRLLANCQATRTTLISTICQWLGFLGVQAEVQQLNTTAGNIQVSLMVGKPDACDPQDWHHLLHNLKLDAPPAVLPITITQPSVSTHQQQTLIQLFSYLLQIGHEHKPIHWDNVQLRLRTLQFDDELITGIQSTLDVPLSLDSLMDNLDADIAAIALPKAVSLALMDRQVNDSESHVLSTLLQLTKA
jgi:hypothetical protein